MNPHIQIFYGKYVNQIENEIPGEHIMLEGVSEVTRSMEPGEPNLPTTDQFTFQLSNLNEEGEQLYPFSFWEEQSRQPEEGATQDLELFFRIVIFGQPMFTGIVKSIQYSRDQADCNITINDLTELFISADVNMLKSYEISELPAPQIDIPGEGFNDLDPALDINGNPVEHESMTWMLDATSWSSTQDGTPTFDKLDRDGNPRSPFAFHLGWGELDYVTPVSSNDGLILDEQDRPVYVQIDEITLWTRCHLWVRQKMNDAGTRFRQELWVTIWHSAEPVVGGRIPRGRFLVDNEFITEQTEAVDIIFHDYNVGFDDDIAISEQQLPVDQNFIFGCSFTKLDSNIRLTNASYSFFDLLELTTKILNTSVSNRFTSQGLTGSVTITSVSTSGDPATFAEYGLICEGVVSTETLFVRISKPGGQNRDSLTFEVSSSDSRQEAQSKAVSAINNGQTSEFWFAQDIPPVDSSFEVTITAKNSGTAWNGYTVTVFKIEGGSTGFPDSDWTGGQTQQAEDGGFTEEGIDLIIGTQVIVTTQDLSAEMTSQQVADLLFNDLDALNHPDYTFTQDGTTIDIISSKSIVETVALDVRSTGVGWTSQDIEGDFEIFDLSRLPERNRLVFFSDVAMFGWIGSRVNENLVSIAWQTSSFLFTNKDGKIAFMARDWEDFFPEDPEDPEFDAIVLDDSDYEPTSGDNYEDGFKSYETTVPKDIVEINNLISKSQVTLYADRDGIRSSPTLKNKRIRFSNFRASDLGVPGIDSESNVPVLRLSPDDEFWPNAEDLDEFIPTPQTQITRFAKSFSFPTLLTRANLFFMDYPELDVGRYILTSDMKLMLIRSISINPRTLLASVEVELKKILNYD